MTTQTETTPEVTTPAETTAAAPADATPAPAETTAAAPADATPAPAETTAAAPAEGKAEFAPYELAAPEGVTVDPEQLKDFAAFANELQIPKDKAEAFSKQFATKQLEAVRTQIANWRKESEADPEIGGAKYEENVAIAKKALKKFGGDEVLKVLDTTGLGNQKDIIRAFLKVGRAMSDDTVSTQNAGTPKPEVTFAGALMAVANTNKS